MANNVRDLRVLGIHPVEPSDTLFRDTLEKLWGPNLRGAALASARADVRDHFAGLYLISVEVEPADADVDWAQVTQPINHQPESNWQVPYDERLIDSGVGHWVFFMHYLDAGLPLRTQTGIVPLPPPSKRPKALVSIEYEAP